MKLRWVRIQNYRSCQDVRLEIGPLHALVGANNAGKSTILRALDFLFNPSATKIDSESFWNCDPTLTIRVEAIFGNLSDEERAKLSPYLRGDGTFYIARTACVSPPEEGSAEEKITISQHYCKPQPKHEWLREAEVNGKNIDRWWSDRPSLTANGVSFAEFVGGTKPKVGDWKEKAKEFVAKHLGADDFEDSWTENPQGYAGVLKGSLPHFIFVPAVKDLSDEAKATKGNPFGRLLYAILDSVTANQRQELEGFVKNLQFRLNRTGGEDRLQGVVQMESRLNALLKQYMDCDLEVEFQAPTLEVLLTTPKLFADDGFRNTAENKGHGLQRAIIFSILRCYSELVTGRADGKKKTMIFAVEEPEIYMHPQAQRTLRRAFLDIAAHQDQVMFSTHSSLLLDVAAFDEIVRVEALLEEKDGKRSVKTRVWQLPMEKMILDLKSRHPSVQPSTDSTRELYSNAYHPNRSEGFFARKVILVEGPTEQYSLPIYAAAMGCPLDMLNISVVDCGGKGCMDRLYRVFNELGIPAYLLFDYDSETDDAEMRRKSVELMKLVGMPPDPPKLTLVTDRLACFPRKWEEDLGAEIAEYEQLATTARDSMGLRGDSGKPLVARYVARRLTEKAPPEIPASIRAVIEAGVKLLWTGTSLQSP